MRGSGFLLLALSASWLVAAAEGPRLAVEPSSFDFGRLRPNVQVTKSFLLTNAGDAALQIESVAGDCGCVAIEGWRSQLQPGESTSMRVALQIEPTQAPGRIVRRLVIKSNDARRELTALEIRAEVVAR